mgnify:CR=1 FL=1
MERFWANSSVTMRVGVVTKQAIFDQYFKLWSLFLPMTSFLLIPSIQGTTPGYLFAFFSIVLVFILKIKINYLKYWMIFVILFAGLTIISQFGTYFSSYDVGHLELVDKTDNSLVFRKSFFTQSMYLVAVFSTFAFIANYYTEKWDKYIFRGAVLLICYGIYEFLYYLIFHDNGDFLSNRSFDDKSSLGLVETHNGSSFQKITFGGITLLRMDSLTGEPSMFAFSLLPFWIYSIHLGKKKLSMVLLTVILLSTSTSAFLGVFLYFIFRLLKYGIKDKMIFSYTTAGILVGGLAYKVIWTVFEKVIFEKLTLQNISGIDRFRLFTENINFFADLHIYQKIFGIGFGTIRSTDFFTTLLVNCGIAGFIVFSSLFFWPLLKLGRDYRDIGLKWAIFIQYFIMMISVPEFAYLPTWLFLGIAYKRIWDRRKQYKLGLTTTP